MSKAIKTEQDLLEFYEGFSKVYGEGIYIKSDLHPCGWDWVDLSCFNDINDMKEQILIAEDFCGGIYKWHQFEGCTPFNMLKQIGKDWCFERNAINWL